MILWLAEASGVDKTLVRKASKLAGKGIPKMKQAAVIRSIISWELIETHLEQLASLPSAPHPEQIAESSIAPTQPISTAPATTTAEVLVEARIGQDRFRANLERAWDAACAVTGCRISEILRASHIKPWEVATDSERLDPENGLLLSAHLDALFDSGLISFANDGRMILSDQIGNRDRLNFRLPQSLRAKPSVSQARFLSYHRRHIFKRS
jgi:hypothetical protein